MSKLENAPFTNPQFALSIITNAPDLETALGISDARVDALTNKITGILDHPTNPTSTEMILAGAKVATTVEELLWVTFKIGTYAEIKTGQGKKILDDHARNNPSTDI